MVRTPREGGVDMSESVALGSMGSPSRRAPTSAPSSGEYPSEIRSWFRFSPRGGAPETNARASSTMRSTGSGWPRVPTPHDHRHPVSKETYLRRGPFSDARKTNCMGLLGRFGGRGRSTRRGFPFARSAGETTWTAEGAARSLRLLDLRGEAEPVPAPLSPGDHVPFMISTASAEQVLVDILEKPTPRC